MEKVNVIAAILVAVIAVLGVAPYVMAETEGAQLEFEDFYPSKLSYVPGDELATFCKVINTGTENVEDATVSITVIDPNGTVVYDFDFSAGSVSAPGAKRIYLNRHLWEVPENATVGKYTIEAVLRWGGNAIMKDTFFYVPIEKEQAGQRLKITSLYTSRLSYAPGDDIRYLCRIKNTGTEATDYFLSMAIFNQNETMYDAMAVGPYTIDVNETMKHIVIAFDIPIDAERGIYEITAIVWSRDVSGEVVAISKTTSFGVDW